VIAQTDSLPFIDVGEGNEVWFQLRGKIAKRETEPSKEKVVGGENGQIATWKRYQLLVKKNIRQSVQQASVRHGGDD
jgi:hypothetical protein